jgi:hypothetical protein
VVAARDYLVSESTQQLSGAWCAQCKLSLRSTAVAKLLLKHLFLGMWVMKARNLCWTKLPEPQMSSIAIPFSLRGQ